MNYVKKVLQNGFKYPKNNVVELIYNFTNAYCEICFKNVLQNGCCFDKIGRCHVDEIGRENCFTGYKYPKNNLIELIFNFTNAYCEISAVAVFWLLPFFGCCRFDKIGHCHFDEIGEIGLPQYGRKTFAFVFVVVFVLVYMFDFVFVIVFGRRSRSQTISGKASVFIFVFDIGSGKTFVFVKYPQNGCKYTQDSTTLLFSTNFITLNLNLSFGGLFTKSFTKTFSRSFSEWLIKTFTSFISFTSCKVEDFLDFVVLFTFVFTKSFSKWFLKTFTSCKVEDFLDFVVLFTFDTISSMPFKCPSLSARRFLILIQSLIWLYDRILTRRFHGLLFTKSFTRSFTKITCGTRADVFFVALETKMIEM